MCRGLTLTMFDIDARIDKSDRKLFRQATNPGHSGLGRFRYMTVLVQRSGQFWYVMTSVHEINFGTCVFCSTTSVHAKYHFGTSLCRYRYIARECLSFYAEGLQMLNRYLVCYVKLFVYN